MSLPDRVASEIDAAVTAKPVDGVLLLQRVTARETSGRVRGFRRAGVIVLAAAAAAAVAAGPSLLRGTEPQAQRPTGTVLAPPGQRAVSWHGVQVFVPDTWGLDDEFCGVPQSDTVIVPGDRLSCLAPPVPGLTVVTFASSTSRPASETVGAAMSPTEVSGRPAFRGTTVPVDEPASTLAVLEVPGLDVTVSVRSPDPAFADALLDTARVVDVDPTGCPSALPATTPPMPDVDGAADRVLPGMPETVSLCEYGDLRLERAGSLGAKQVREFQAVLDAAPVGTSPSQVGISVSPELCPEYDRSPLVLLATYRDDSTLQVFTRQNSCTGPDPDNGLRQVRMPQDAVAVLYQALAANRRSPLPLGPR